MRYFLLVCLLLAAGPAARAQVVKPAISATVPHPAWALRGNIYEVNVRQYTPEGTLNAFARHLDRLQKMGVQTLWLMPLNPICRRERRRAKTLSSKSGRRISSSFRSFRGAVARASFPPISYLTFLN